MSSRIGTRRHWQNQEASNVLVPEYIPEPKDRDVRWWGAATVTKWRPTYIQKKYIRAGISWFSHSAAVPLSHYFALCHPRKRRRRRRRRWLLKLVKPSSLLSPCRQPTLFWGKWE